MKRILIRLSALAGVIVLGLIAIAHAQREIEDPQDDTAAVTPPAASAVLPTDGALSPTGGIGEPAVSLSADRAELFSSFPNDGKAPSQRFDAQDETTQLDSQERQSPRDSNDRFSSRPAAATDLMGQPGLDANFRQDHFGGEIPAGSGPRLDAALAQDDGGYQSADPAPLNHDANLGNAEIRPDDRFSRSRNTDLADDARATVLAAGGPTLPIDDATDRADTKTPPAGRFQVVEDARPLSTSRSGGVEKRQFSDNTIAPAATTPAREEDGTGTPGDKQLEGSQTPSLTVLKSAPSEVQVGKPATFEVSVRNSGKTAVAGVEIHDTVPKGTRLISTTPQATRGPGGTLIWLIGALQPGEQVKVQMQLTPIVEGEIGSVASVVFRSEASARTTATKPQLSIQVSAPRKVMIGDGVTLKIKMSNTGSGTATGVVLSQNVPAALKHPAGNQLEFDVGTLTPGEVREIELVLSTVQAGAVTNTLTVQGDGDLTAEAITKFEIVAPALAVSVDGPKRRYLERRATYTVTLSNPGTATAKNVELLTRLPKGLKFVKANNAGSYDAATHTVYWSLEELPPNESGTVTLVALPVEAGTHKLRVETKSDQGLSASAEQTTRVEGLAAILFEVADVNDPIEVGEETTYEVRVVNQGSKASIDIVVVAVLPDGITPISTDGPTRGVIEGQRVTFQALPRLAPKADTTYRIRAKGVRPGDLRIRVQLQTAEMTTPVTKEESTRVYVDE